MIQLTQVAILIAAIAIGPAVRPAFAASGIVPSKMNPQKPQPSEYAIREKYRTGQCSVELAKAQAGFIADQAECFAKGNLHACSLVRDVTNAIPNLLSDYTNQENPLVRAAATKAVTTGSGMVTGTLVNYAQKRVDVVRNLATQKLDNIASEYVLSNPELLSSVQRDYAKVAINNFPEERHQLNLAKLKDEISKDPSIQFIREGAKLNGTISQADLTTDLSASRIAAARKVSYEIVPTVLPDGTSAKVAINHLDNDLPLLRDANGKVITKAGLGANFAQVKDIAKHLSHPEVDALMKAERWPEAKAKVAELEHDRWRTAKVASFVQPSSMKSHQYQNLIRSIESSQFTQSEKFELKSILDACRKGNNCEIYHERLRSLVTSPEFQSINQAFTPVREHFPSQNVRFADAPKADKEATSAATDRVMNSVRKLDAQNSLDGVARKSLLIRATHISDTGSTLTRAMYKAGSTGARIIPRLGTPLIIADAAINREDYVSGAGNMGAGLEEIGQNSAQKFRKELNGRPVLNLGGRTPNPDQGIDAAARFSEGMESLGRNTNQAADWTMKNVMNGECYETFKNNSNRTIYKNYICGCNDKNKSLVKDGKACQVAQNYVESRKSKCTPSDDRVTPQGLINYTEAQAKFLKNQIETGAIKPDQADKVNLFNMCPELCNHWTSASEATIKELKRNQVKVTEDFTVDCDQQPTTGKRNLKLKNSNHLTISSNLNAAGTGEIIETKSLVGSARGSVEQRIRYQIRGGIVQQVCIKKSTRNQEECRQPATSASSMDVEYKSLISNKEQSEPGNEMSRLYFIMAALEDKKVQGTASSCGRRPGHPSDNSSNTDTVR